MITILLAGCVGSDRDDKAPPAATTTPSSPQSTTAALPATEWEVAVLGRIDICGVCQRGSFSMDFTKVLAGKSPTGQAEGTIAIAGMAKHLLPDEGVPMYQSREKEIVFLYRANESDLYTVVEVMKATPENLAMFHHR